MRPYQPEFMEFTRSQWRGIVFLLLCVLFVYLIPMFWKEPVYRFDYSAVDAFADSLWKASKKEYHFQAFDPNTVDSVSLVHMGFHPHDVRTLLKYRKFARFKRPEDFKKLYFVEDSFYAQIAPFLQIQVKDRKRKRSPLSTSERIWIELNSSDSLQLLQVKGIGPFYAAKILRLRKALGGFVSLDQLKLLPYVDQQKLKQLKEQIWVDSSLVVPMNVNTSTWKELVRHPYLGAAEATKIIEYRRFGFIESLEEVKQLVDLGEEEWIRLRLYLRTKDPI